jgi:protein TonB
MKLLLSPVMSLIMLTLIAGCGAPDDAPPPAISSTKVAAIDTPPPDYPLEQACDEVGGKVLMNVVVGTTGTPSRIRIIESSGVVALDDAAQKAVRNWRFRPATRSGRPVEETIQVPMSFKPPTEPSELCEARAEAEPNRL